MNIQYIKDSEVTEILDEKIRDILSRCFIKNQDAEVFSRQRYYNEMPGHRYLLWKNEQLIAHIAVHDKSILIDGVMHNISGIAEVCVDIHYRKQGLVKSILAEIHQHRMQSGDAFSILFGESEIYASSGYTVVNNLKALNHNKAWSITGHTMVHSLNKSWPETEVKLVGIPF